MATHVDHTNSDGISHKGTGCAARTDAYAVRQLHNQAHKRPPWAIDITKEHIMGHKQLFAESDLITIGQPRSHAKAWMAGIDCSSNIGSTDKAARPSW